MNKLLVLNQISKPNPVIPIWTREKIANLQLHLSGMMIQTKQYGIKPWFELAYQCLTDPADRKWVREQKKLNGDTHQIIEFFTYGQFFYNEPNVWLNQCFSPSMEQNPDLYYLLAKELIEDDLVPVSVYDGDNGDNPSDGAPNAIRQLPLMRNALGDLKDNILYARFWDGVWYGSSRESIEDFGIRFRTLYPKNENVLFIEMQPGVIQCGDDVITYGMNGLLHYYDGVCSEFDSNVHQDSTWQVAGRMIKDYIRPSDQPSWDDPNPPYYLGQGSFNSRGKYYWIPLENKAYEWVRLQVSPSELARDREYFASMGCTNICW